MNIKHKVLFLVVALLLIGSSMGLAAYNINPTTEEALKIADNIMAWQTESGGWNKNQDYTVVMWEPGMRVETLGTFDNNASIDEMKFLALMYNYHGDERYKESFMKGLEWMLNAQYPSGGWPQYYPMRGGYSDYVTYNDDAMVRVLGFIQNMLDRPRTYQFIGDENIARLEVAYEKGIDFILKSQIEVNGHLTVWCQQHDPVTYEPRMGRSYEHIALVSNESIGVVRFLMSLVDPSEEVQRAILGALEWFSLAQLPDGRWARFYDIESNTPIFSGRDGVIRYRVTDIELERQQGYSWYNSGAKSLLDQVESSGYLERLLENLTDHQPLTWDVFTDPAIPLITSPQVWPTIRASGVLPIEVDILMRNRENFEQLVIKVNNTEIYRGSEMGVTIEFDTTTLVDGVNNHVLLVETLTKDGVSFSDHVRFGVNNR